MVNLAIHGMRRFQPLWPTRWRPKHHFIVTDLILEHLSTRLPGRAILVFREGFNLAGAQACLYHKIPYWLLTTGDERWIKHHKPTFFKIIEDIYNNADRRIGDGDMTDVFGEPYPVVLDWLIANSDHGLTWHYRRRPEMRKGYGMQKGCGRFLLKAAEAEMPVYNLFPEFIRNVRSWRVSAPH